MSYPEVLLWQRLRGAPTGLRFRRAHAVGLDYVADFCCASARLVVEVDGEIHDQPRVIVGDAHRDAFMRDRGLTIVRISARDILRNADEVAAAIAAKPLHHRSAAGGPPPQLAGEDQA